MGMSDRLDGDPTSQTRYVPPSPNEENIPNGLFTFRERHSHSQQWKMDRVA